MRKKAFVKMKVWEDETSYNKAVKSAEDKIGIVKQGLEWCNKHIDIGLVDRKKFVADMVAEFNRQLVEQKGDIVKQAIAVEKLHFLLDIHITELLAIRERFDRIDVNIYVEDNDFICGVSLEDYTLYTKNEEENQRLIICNNLIDAIDKVEKYNKCYAGDICRGTSGFLKFDFRKNVYIPNI
jgi:hypothetical protein|tara:strand:+ start:272 stop:817 length:546 start_codon:yes stop_codon:yes gene_type:complete